MRRKWQILTPYRIDIPTLTKFITGDYVSDSYRVPISGSPGVPDPRNHHVEMLNFGMFDVQWTLKNELFSITGCRKIVTLASLLIVTHRAILDGHFESESHIKISVFALCFRLSYEYFHIRISGPKIDIRISGC